MWQAVVMIPKGGRDYRIIGLMYMVWKVVAVILNCRNIDSITFHDFLHGLRAGCGTGTTTLEAKLLQKFSAIREKVLYMIFLVLHKASDILEWDICLKILEGYSVGP